MVGVNMKKFMLYYSAIVGSICGILLVVVLNTYYEFRYCDCNGCYVGKQKIFDYMIGRD